MYDRETGRHRGFAYATFSNNDEAMAAINGNNVIHGKLVIRLIDLVNYSSLLLINFWCAYSWHPPCI